MLVLGRVYTLNHQPDFLATKIQGCLVLGSFHLATGTLKHQKTSTFSMALKRSEKIWENSKGEAIFVAKYEEKSDSEGIHKKSSRGLIQINLNGRIEHRI